MPYWNKELQQWGYLYHEEVSSFQWLGIRRDLMSPIDKPYAYHKPSADGLAKITQLRMAFSDVERAIRENCPDSRQKAVAITQLETAAMWAIKAVVFNDPDSEVE